MAGEARALVRVPAAVVVVIVALLCFPAASSAQFQFAFEFGGAGTGPPAELSPQADGVAVDSEGNVWVVDAFANRLVKYDYNGGFIASINAPIGGGGSFNRISDVAADSRGHVFVLDEGNMEVVELANSGRFQRRFGQNGALADRLSSPQGLAVAPNGRIFVTDPGHARIAIYTTTGAVDRFITTVANPNRISFVATQQFVVTQAQDVLRVNARNGAIDRSANASTGTAEGVAYNPADKRVYVADFGGSVLKAFNVDLSTVVNINTAGVGSGLTNGPSGVAADCRGNVYLTDGAVPDAAGFPGASKVLKFGDPAAKPPPCGAPPGPISGLDTQVNDIEVTQAIQNLQPYTATDAASGPRTRTFGAPEVDMRAGAKTVVRVYANLRGGDAGGAANVPATLEGITGAGTKLGTITPDAGPAVLRIGDSVTDMAERLDPAGAYTFTLPESWSLIGKLNLIARVNPAGIDCDDACQRRSTFRLNGVKFRETLRGCSVRTGGGRPRPACDSNYGVNVWPIAMLNRGVYPLMNGSPLMDPGPAFDMARLVTPADLVVSPWMGEIDASGIENGTQVKQESCFLGIELGITCSDDTIQLMLGNAAQQAATRKLLEGIILDRLERMKEDRNIGDSVVLEALRGRPGARNGGVLPGVMRGKYLEDQEDDPEDVGGRGYADLSRPLGTVAHELQHALGRRHAGAKASCYPDPKQVGESWPEPTDSGALIGTGLDLRPRSGGFRGPYRIISPGLLGLASPLGDLMSYCIPGESQIWISTVGWNQILNYRGISTSPARAPDHVAQTGPGALIRVTAVELDDGRLAISGIQPTRGRTNAANPAAEYQLQARDAQGNILASSPGSAQTSADTGGTMIVGAVPRPPARLRSSWPTARGPPACRSPPTRRRSGCCRRAAGRSRASASRSAGAPPTPTTTS